VYNVTTPAPTQNGTPPRPAILPPLPPEPAPIFSIGFILFAILAIGGAGLGGALQSGKLTLGQFSHAAHAAVSAVAPAPAKVPPPPAGTFVVTSILLGQPSIAIINGKSQAEGAAVDAPGVTGWKVSRILDGVVWMKNGVTLAPIPLTLPGIKPLDDSLRPLN